MRQMAHKATAKATRRSAKEAKARTRAPASAEIRAVLQGLAPATAGGPLQLDMSLIQEDPEQPRTENNPGFSDESLDELTASIRLRGVKTPISVRIDPSGSGRFVINHGARRYRASRRAGKTIIPGFIDNDYNKADQVVENLQRNELTAREIADYIGRELAKGITKAEIAKGLSKSRAFVTQHVALLDLPDPIAEVFNSGRARDVTVVNELVTAFKKTPQEVSAWLADQSQEITRSAVKLFREFLNEKGERDEAYSVSYDELGNGSRTGESTPFPHNKKKTKDPADPNRMKKTIVRVIHNRRLAHLILDRRPPAEGYAWLRSEDDGKEFKADLTKVQLVALVEG